LAEPSARVSHGAGIGHPPLPIRPASEGDTTFSSNDFGHALRNPDAIFLVAEGEDRVAGYVVGFVVPTKRDEAIVHSTTVHRAARGKGHGSALVRAFCDVVWARNVDRIFAVVEAGPDAFDERCGFTKEATWPYMSRRRRDAPS